MRPNTRSGADDKSKEMDVSGSPDTTRWFVMRAHKSEKLAEEKLSTASGLEYYIPKAYEPREYHGVKTKKLVPVIPSMVFVHASHNQIVDFKKGNNFLQFITRKTVGGTDYLVVPDGQMADFIRVTANPELNTVYFRPDELNLKQGTKVRILGGGLSGVTGIFMRVAGKRNRRVVVTLDGIISAVTEVSPDLIEVIKE